MKGYVCIVEVDIGAESKDEASEKIKEALSDLTYCDVPTIIIGEETTKYCYDCCKEVIDD